MRRSITLKPTQKRCKKTIDHYRYEQKISRLLFPAPKTRKISSVTEKQTMPLNNGHRS
jgi:hypothetical protein